jgi:2'-5' RNA ligase
MFSIAALIEAKQAAPWQKLASLCEFTGVITHTISHFSWQTAENYRIEPLKEKLTALTENISPFSFTTSGLGVFPGDRKILFLIIVKTKKLLEIHEMLWKELSIYAEGSKAHYAPENWIPHISINLYKLTDDQFNCSFAELIKTDLNFEFKVSKFGLIYLNKESAGIDTIFPLKQSESK